MFSWLWWTKPEQWGHSLGVRRCVRLTVLSWVVKQMTLHRCVDCPSASPQACQKISLGSSDKTRQIFGTSPPSDALTMLSFLLDRQTQTSQCSLYLWGHTVHFGDPCEKPGWGRGGKEHDVNSPLFERGKPYSPVVQVFRNGLATLSKHWVHHRSWPRSIGTSLIYSFGTLWVQSWLRGSVWGTTSSTCSMMNLNSCWGDWAQGRDGWEQFFRAQGTLCVYLVYPGIPSQRLRVNRAVKHL